MTPIASPPATRAYEGGLYIGAWSGGRPEGRGRHTFSLGSCFEGVFAKGWADGPGTYHWLDGRADVGRFHGPLERLPLLAATGEGARWNVDRTLAWRLRDGVEREAISLSRAMAIAHTVGQEVPAKLPPKDHGAARVTKRELETQIRPLLSKRQRTDLDRATAVGHQSGGVKTTTTSVAMAEKGSDRDEGGYPMSFEEVWRVLTGTQQ